MATIQQLSEINKLLILNDINHIQSTFQSESACFDEWMQKIQNIHWCDNEAMCAAYERIENPNERIPFVKEIKLKYGSNP